MGKKNLRPKHKSIEQLLKIAEKGQRPILREYCSNAVLEEVKKLCYRLTRPDMKAVYRICKDGSLERKIEGDKTWIFVGTIGGALKEIFKNHLANKEKKSEK